MNKYKKSGKYGNQFNSRYNLGKKTNALMESMEKFRQHQKRMEARLSNLITLDRAATNMVSIFKRSSLSMQEDRLEFFTSEIARSLHHEFSAAGTYGEDDLVPSGAATSPICSYDDGDSTQGMWMCLIH